MDRTGKPSRPLALALMSLADPGAVRPLTK